MVHKNRLLLVKKAEGCQLRALRKPHGQKGNAAKETNYKKTPYRPEDSMDNGHKLSLAFFLKKTDELTYHFAKSKLRQTLQTFYPEIMTSDLFDEMLSCFLTQKPKRLCNLELRSQESQKSFHELLVHESNPLEDLITTETFKDNAICYFFFLKRDLFEQFFQSDELISYLEKEWQQRKDVKSFVLVKERVTPLLISVCPEWNLVYFDQMLSFQTPPKKNIKAQIKDHTQEFFYYPTNEVDVL